MSKTNISREEMRRALREDRSVDPEMAERWRFATFARSLIPEMYLKREEAYCFSIERGYRPLYELGFSQRSHRLSLANIATATSKQFPHIFGNGEKPCEGCLRRLEAAALHHAIDSIHQSPAKQTILTPEAKIIVESLYKQRVMEKKELDRGSTLFYPQLKFIRLEIPNSGDCTDNTPNFNTTHLVFYDTACVRAGQQDFAKMFERILSLRDLSCSFGAIIESHARKVPHPYYLSISQHDTEKYEGSRLVGRDTTIVEIISRGDYKKHR